MGIYKLILALLGSFLAMTGSLAAAAPASDLLAQEPTLAFETAPCMFEGLDLGLTQIAPEDQGFECGYVTVPERHSNPDGATIRLPVAIRRATGEATMPDPLFLAQGGPGGSAFEVFSILVPNTAIAAERDIVIFNQRGTQYAEPDLTCTEVFDVTPQLLEATGDEADNLYREALTACHDRLQAEGIDLSAYNSLENAADVDTIREALGYDTYNFYGVSYGTLLGLHLMRDYPDHLRTVILDSVVPTSVNYILQSPQSENRVYDELFGACAAVPACQSAYPGLETRYFALVDKLDAEPVTLTLRNPDTGEETAAVLDGTGLRQIMFQLFYLGNFAAAFPKVISELEEGDFTYLEQMWPLFAFDRSISEGMFYSVICSEDADFQPIDAPLDGLRPIIAADVEEDLQFYLNTCSEWQVDELGPSVDDPVRSEIPTLLLTGQYDPITPPAFAAEAAETLPNSYVIVSDKGAHGVAFQDACINDIMQSFLNSPQTEPFQSCLTNTGIEEFTPADAIVLPLMGKVNSLDSTLITQAITGFLLFLGVLSVFVVWFLSFLINALRKHPPYHPQEEKRLRRIGYLLAIGFSVLLGVFVVALTVFIGSALLDLRYAIALAIPGAAWPFFLIPPLLVLIAAGMVIVSIRQWRTGVMSGFGRVYFSLVTLCAIGCLVLLGMQGLLLPPS